MTGPVEPRVTYVPPPTATSRQRQRHSPYGAPPRPYSYTPQPPAAPPRAPTGGTRRRVVGGAIGAAVVAGTTVAVVTMTAAPASDADHRMDLPRTFDGYRRLDDAAARQVEASIRSSGSTDPVMDTVYDAAAIGVYARNTTGDPVLVTLTLPTSRVRALKPSGSHATVEELLARASAPAARTTLAVSARTGNKDCEYTSVADVAETVCAWSDEHTTGLLVSTEQPRITTLRLSALQTDFRDALR